MHKLYWGVASTTLKLYISIISFQTRVVIGSSPCVVLIIVTMEEQFTEDDDITIENLENDIVEDVISELQLQNHILV